MGQKNVHYTHHFQKKGRNLAKIQWQLMKTEQFSNKTERERESKTETKIQKNEMGIIIYYSISDITHYSYYNRHIITNKGTIQAINKIRVHLVAQKEYQL